MAVTNLPDHIENDLVGLATYGTYSGTNKECVASLIDLVAAEATTTQRGMLDQMSAAAHRQLLAELQALHTAIDNV